METSNTRVCKDFPKADIGSFKIKVALFVSQWTLHGIEN